MRKPKGTENCGMDPPHVIAAVLGFPDSGFVIDLSFVIWISSFFVHPRYPFDPWFSCFGVKLVASGP